MAWEFLPGMRFGERAAWWRGAAARAADHEGLDICRYRTRDGRRLGLVAGARVPAVWAGEVVAVVPDFLGVSVFVAHESRDGRGWRLHTAYGHVLPRAGLAPGSLLGDGEEIGTIADTAARRHAVPPHLHLTLALIDPAAGEGVLDWGALREKSRVQLLDPMIIMTG